MVDVDECGCRCRQWLRKGLWVDVYVCMCTRFVLLAKIWMLRKYTVCSGDDSLAIMVVAMV